MGFGCPQIPWVEVHEDATIFQKCTPLRAFCLENSRSTGRGSGTHAFVSLSFSLPDLVMERLDLTADSDPSVFFLVQLIIVRLGFNYLSEPSIATT